MDSKRKFQELTIQDNFMFAAVMMKRFTLPMGDFSRSIFLSTKGKDTDSIPKELKSILDFIRKDTPENNTKADDAYVKDLQRSIRRVKNNRKLERSFMSLDDVRKLGIKEGRLQARREIILEFLEELGDVSATLKTRIISESETDVLKSMLKLVKTAASIEDFEEKISNL